MIFYLGFVVSVVVVVLAYERIVRALRLELNQARANEQLLLTRLASRTPAEYHAATSLSTHTTDVEPSVRYLRDLTGLQTVVVPDGEGVA